MKPRLNPYLAAPEAMKALDALEAYVVGCGLEPSLIELVKTRASQINGCAFILVSYASGGKSPAHHHAGSVLAYVLSGAIRSENSATGPAKVYQAGESFFEPPGSEHLVSENASATEPASLLAIFVADDGAQLTTFYH